jgi:uncharacterized protein YecE (DUF72 family)
MLNWYLGTMGFSYQDWKGVFYPESTASRDYLAHYSQFFNAVEMDSTFYGPPREKTVTRWSQIIPPGFKICPKMPREITHDHGLKNATEAANFFIDRIRILDDKLGPILIQLPPDYAFDQRYVLTAFLAQLPADVRFAVEFRDPSWHAAETGEILQRYQICWASTEYIHLPQRIYVTTDFVYIRWIGRHGRYDVNDHERVDMTPRLKEWYDDIQSRSDEFDTVYGFFNNDYAGHSPATCNRFMEMVGLPTKHLTPPTQGRLFD